MWVRLAAVLRRLWFPAAIAFLYLYSFPYFAAINSANELPRIYLTMAMAERGAFNIDPELRRYPDTPDTSTFRGKRYSNKAPGMSLITVPVYLGQKWVNGNRTPELPRMFFWFRLIGATVPSLLFLLLVWRLLTELISELAMRRLVLAAYALGTMAFTYGTVFIAHQLSSLLMATAFILTFLYRRGLKAEWSLGLAGLSAGAAVLTDYQVAFIGPPLFLYVVWAVRTRLGRTFSWPALRPALLFCVGTLPPFVFLLWYHFVCFGSPFKTGYNYLSNPVFSEWHSQGFLGLSHFRLTALLDRHFSADDGLFYYSPFLLLAIPGLILMLRRRDLRAEGVLCAAVVGFFVYFISSLAFISGWDVGPRYVTCALPFYMVPIAVLASAVAGRWQLRAAVSGLIALSIIIYLTVSVVFPHYPDNFSNPWLDVTLRFGRAGYFPYNLGWLLGLKGLASAMPYLVVAGALLFLLIGSGPLLRWQRATVTALALLLAFSITLYYHHQLSSRRMPVPVSFLPWMERMWEPRHEGMDLRKLLPVGDPRTCGLRTALDR